MQLAQKYTDQYVGGWWASIKLDGMRMFWDGGITRDLDTRHIPWANTAKDKWHTVSTGLWSRGAKPIYAPDWWLDKLPSVPLDGEGYFSIQSFEKTCSLIKGLSPSFQGITFRVYNSPAYQSIFKDGMFEIKKHQIHLHNADKWAMKRAKEKNIRVFSCPLSLKDVYYILENQFEQNNVWQLHKQEQLEYTGYEDRLREMFTTCLQSGYEGIMLTDPYVPWKPERSHQLLKLKPFSDMEVKIVGYTFGRGKYLGMIGAMIVRDDHNRVFRVSGFTDEERRLNQECVNHALNHEGDEVFQDISDRFSIGERITIKFRELTSQHIPKEARYLRKREDE